MSNLTKESIDFLTSIDAVVVRVVDGGMSSSVRVTLSNGMVGYGYYPAWRPLDLMVRSFRYPTEGEDWRFR